MRKYETSNNYLLINPIICFEFDMRNHLWSFPSIYRSSFFKANFLMTSLILSQIGSVKSNWPSAKTGANNSSFLKQKASKIQSREEEMVVVWGPSLLVWKKRRQQQNAGSRQVKACMCPSKQKTRRPVMSTGPSPSTSYVCWVWFGKKC